MYHMRDGVEMVQQVGIAVPAAFNSCAPNSKRPYNILDSTEKR